MDTSTQQPESEMAESETVDIAEILTELNAGYHKLPVKAIRAAQQNQELIIPHLIQSIERATEIVAAGDNLEGDTHFFALFLLVEFKAKQAFPAILKAISLPDEGPFELFGDAIHEVIHRAIVVLAEEPLEIIEQLITDASINEYVAWKAARCPLLLVKEKLLTREEAVQLMLRWLRNAIDSKDARQVSFIACELYSYSSEEAMEFIREAYQKKLVDESIIDLGNIEAALQHGEAGFQRELSREDPANIDDTVEELKTWSSFTEKQSPKPYNPVIEDENDHRDDQAEDWEENTTTIHNETPKIGRNEPCPCGSGKKYKKCCGKK